MAIGNWWDSPSSEMIVGRPPNGRGGRGPGGGWPGRGGLGGKKNFNVTGFSARKAASSGVLDTDISNYAAADWNPDSEFNATTGVWAPTKLKGNRIIWIGGAGFPDAGMPGGTGTAEWRLSIRNAAAVIGQMTAKDFSGSHSHGDSNFLSAILQGANGNTYTLYQQNDVAQNVWFSACTIDTNIAFSAWKAASTGASGDAISGYTEMFDINGDFNPTTGVFTVPVTGYYLLCAHGFPATGTNVPWELATMISGAFEFHAVSRLGAGSWGNSVGYCLLLSLTAGNTINLRQTGGAAQLVQFSMARVTPSVAFSARKPVASGTIGGDITGWTERFDLGSNFNPTTGVFTAPSDGQYLVTWGARTSGFTSSATESQYPLFVDASEYVRTRRYISGATHDHHGRGGVVLNLTAGQTLKLKQNGNTGFECFFTAMQVG